MGPGRTIRKRPSAVAKAHLFLVIALSLASRVSGAENEPTSSPGPTTPQDLVGALKHLEKTLGFRKTKNFSSHSDQSVADYRCYYTGKLELPESYEGLKLATGTKDGCTLDPAKFDVFFYPIEAVGSGETPVTSTLERDSTERLLVVVPHEDFHGSEQLDKLPATLNEAASTLIGFLTAGEVAREKFGAGSEVYRNLLREPELFLQKATIVNRYHARVGQLYAAVQSGEVSQTEALAQKEELFQEIHQSCQAISPDPRSFNKCPAANNNAGLAFDETYTKYYPMMYELYAANGQKLKETIGAIKQALATESEAEALQRLRELIKHAGGWLPPSPERLSRQPALNLSENEDRDDAELLDKSKPGHFH
jgi:hypothetical protein